MSPALYVLDLVDDFGNKISPASLPYDLYMVRYNYFNTPWGTFYA